MKNDKAHNPGFQLPDNYFDSFESDLAIRMAEGELPSDAGFRMPNGYLNTLEAEVYLKLPQSFNRVIPIRQPVRMTHALAIAASLLLIWYAIKPSADNLVFNPPMAEVDTYVQNGGLDIEMHDIAQMLTDEDIETLTSNPVFSMESLENYLINNVDSSTYLNE